ncbi:MAG: hypothetical protein K0R90_1272 [Oscillospiraceae bacterium]|nr:hypothetical protein [Oscillospiraceae bacterium]
MPKNQKKEDELLSCIKCDAHNCAYNDNQRHCVAKEISVGNHFATTSDDTVCETFKQQ